MPGVTLENLAITQTFYGWFSKTNEIIDTLNTTVGSGVSGAGVSGGSLIITLVDGTTLDAGSVIGPQGIGVSAGGLCGDNLIITLSNGVTFDVGTVKGPQGATGFQGNIGVQGVQGQTGTQGLGLPAGGLIGYSLVKKTNADYTAEWKDLTLQVKATPGNIGGWETKKIENIVGEGPSTSGRNRFPRWSPNIYVSEYHEGPGVSLDGSTGFFMSAGYLGNSSGYDDGVTSGYKVLNFFENTTLFEGNTFFGRSGETLDCSGSTLDAPPGFYWNRMKYFPTAKLTPIYLSNYSVVDQFVMYIAGYRDGATASSVVNKKKRRGTFGFFGILPINSFPSGTPYSSLKDNYGFIPGSTCTYYFRPAGAASAGESMGVAVTDSNFNITGVIDAAYTGPHVKEVIAGRTGPIGLLPNFSGPEGVSGGFTLEPGWYYIFSEFIPAAWFSVGTAYDVTAGTGAGPYLAGTQSDGVIVTHTNAEKHNGDIGAFGLNGFELAPEGTVVHPSIPKAFTPSCSVGVSVVRGVDTTNLRSLQHPTGLPAHLWYNYGFSGATHYGRFLTGGTGTFVTADHGMRWYNKPVLGPHVGLHSYDVSSQEAEITEEGGIAVRAQNAPQGSAPRIGLSITSTSNSLETLTTFQPEIKPVAGPVCTVNCKSLNETIWFATESNEGITGQRTGEQFGLSGPCSQEGACPKYCCPGTTYANFAFDGRAGGADAAFYGAAYNAGIDGKFVQCYTDFVNAGGDFCAYPDCGCTSGYRCQGGVSCWQPGVECSELPGFAGCVTPQGVDPTPNQDQGAGLSGTVPTSRTISIFVNTGEDHHVKWFGEGAGTTSSNHLIWHTSTYGCTSGTTFPVYEGPE